MAVHQPGTDVVVGDSDAPCPPSGRHLIHALLGVAIQHRSVTPGWRVVREMSLVGDGIICSIAGSQVPIMLAVGVHGMILKDARGARVAEPDYVQYLPDLSRPGPHPRIPTLVLHCNLVIGCLPSRVCVDKVGFVV